MCVPGCQEALHAALSRRGFLAGDAARTGKDANGTMHFPGISPDLAEWLLKERSVLGLAVDDRIRLAVKRRNSGYFRPDRRAQLLRRIDMDHFSRIVDP